MTLERNIERPAVREIRRQEYETIKIGWDGWPDHLVLLGGGFHFWQEYKRSEGGRLRKVQEVRHEIMRDAGETIYVPRSLDEALEQLEHEVRLHHRRSPMARDWRWRH